MTFCTIKEQPKHSKPLGRPFYTVYQMLNGLLAVKKQPCEMLISIFVLFLCLDKKI